MQRNLEIFLICIKTSSNGPYDVTFFSIALDNNITRHENKTVTTRPTPLAFFQEFFSGGIYCHANVFVMLLFSDQISGRGKVSEGDNQLPSTSTIVNALLP